MRTDEGLDVLGTVFPNLKLHVHDATELHWEETVKALQRLSDMEGDRASVIEQADRLGLWVDKFGCVSFRR